MSHRRSAHWPVFLQLGLNDPSSTFSRLYRGDGCLGPAKTTPRVIALRGVIAKWSGLCTRDPCTRCSTRLSPAKSSDSLFGCSHLILPTLFGRRNAYLNLATPIIYHWTLVSKAIDRQDASLRASISAVQSHRPNAHQRRVRADGPRCPR